MNGDPTAVVTPRGVEIFVRAVSGAYPAGRIWNLRWSGANIQRRWLSTVTTTDWPLYRDIVAN